MYERTLVDSFLYDIFLIERERAKDATAPKLLLQVEEENWEKIIEEMRDKFPTGQCDRAEVEVIGTFEIRKSTYPYGDTVKYSFAVSEFKQVKCISQEP
jgi:hypothetical protein